MRPLSFARTRAVRWRLADDRGYTLSELVVVMAILTIVVAPLSSLFVSALNTETDQRVRFDAQQQARIALDALRGEVHCASAITQAGASPTVTLTLPTGCPSGAGSVTWCTVSAGSSRYRLYRKAGVSCDASGKLYADYITAANIFNYTASTSTVRAKLHVDLPVDLTPADTLAAYDLFDDLVLRNSSFA